MRKFDYACTLGYTILRCQSVDCTQHLALRAGPVRLSIVPAAPISISSPSLSSHFVCEIEHRTSSWGQRGHGRGHPLCHPRLLWPTGSERTPTRFAWPQVVGGPPHLSAVRQYTTRPPTPIAVPELTSSSSCAQTRDVRARGLRDGNIARRPAFPASTAPSRRFSSLLRAHGKRLGRRRHGGALPPLSPHLGSSPAFFNAVGLGPPVRRLHPGRTPASRKNHRDYYAVLPIFSCGATFDYQFITNPAYNRRPRPSLGDRDPPAALSF